MESSLPCADCLVGCYAGAAEPDWASAQETCSFLDAIFHIGDDGTVLHDPCAQLCDAYVAGHAIELYLACHGGVGLVGGADDTVATVDARGVLVERITGLCFTLRQELGQSWHGQEQCVDAEVDCGLWAAAGECTANYIYMRQKCRMSCGECAVLDPSTHMCVTDQLVLDAVGTVPRHMFTPHTLDGWPAGAYRDWSQVIGFGATISTPHVQALMTQLLQLSGQDRAAVLEIGTGSGYQTALLVQMGWDVHTIEIEPHLKERSTRWLTEAGFMSTGRLHTRMGDGYLGWPSAGPFRGIIVTCSPTHIPQPLKEQLAIGGRMIIPVGPDLALSRLLVVTRTSPTTWSEEFLFTCRWVPLQSACVHDHCDSVANETLPTCPAQRHAHEMAAQPAWTGSGFASHAMDYFHATVVCTTNPCGTVQCLGGHDATPTCCVETVDGTPCSPRFRADDGTLVDCAGLITPCDDDNDCDADSWCRGTEHVALETHGTGLVRRQCVPYAPDGAACEGFTLPWFFEKCQPASTCAVLPGQNHLPGVCQSGAVCNEIEFYYQTCHIDGDCRNGYSCGVVLDGCVPATCTCDHQCTGGCTSNVGLCEIDDCDPSNRQLCELSCPPVVNPVCGADRLTYTNECLAECSCVEIASDGACTAGNG